MICCSDLTKHKGAVVELQFLAVVAHPASTPLLEGRNTEAKALPYSMLNIF